MKNVPVTDIKQIWYKLKNEVFFREWQLSPKFLD